MPTVAREGAFSFIIHTRELPFEPPHVHVRFGDDEVRVELLGGTFMDDPPPRRRQAILTAFRLHADAIWRTWEAVHGEGPDGNG
jgi:hypothetical protein